MGPAGFGIDGSSQTREQKFADPRHKCAARWHDPFGARPLAESSSGEPLATMICSWTKSKPVTNSVTGCSTCSRVFISIKKNSFAGVVEDELDGPGTQVVDGLGCLDGHLAHLFPDRVWHGDAGGLFDQLLVTSLHRALTLVQVADIAEACRRTLEFQCALGILNESLNEDSVVGKIVLPLGLARAKGAGSSSGFFGDPDSLSATTGRGFDDHG